MRSAFPQTFVQASNQVLPSVVQCLLSYQIANHIRVFPLIKTCTVLHVLGDVIATLVPTDADLFALVETTTKDSSWQQGDTNVRKRGQGSSRVVTLVVLHEILLSIKDAVAANNDTGPIFSRLMHPHFMLLPIRLGLEGLQRFLFSAIGAEHVRLTRLALVLAV